jgi:phosphoserine phosphatase RsbU/P
MRILVVDDDPIHRTVLASLLRARGHEVETAPDVDQAWKLLLHTPARIVFVDWMMPRVNGLELVRRIRAHEFGQYVYVVLCTGRDSRGDLVEGMRSGADDFLAKPVDGEELWLKVASGSRIAQLEDRLEEDKRKLGEANIALSLAYGTMRADLESAAEMQRSLLTAPARIHNVQFEWLFCPAKVVAGDILGFFPLDENSAAFYQVDVSGHGIPAAMFSVLLSKLLTTSPVSSSLLKHAIAAEPWYVVTPPNEAIAELNQRLQGNGDMYFTMVYGIVNTTTRRLSFSQAGHPHPIYLPHGNPAVALGSGGFPVGVLPDMEYDLIERDVKPGDRLFLASDGITECTSRNGEQFGTQRLIRFIEEHRDEPLETLLTVLQRDLRDWVGCDEFQDDLSIVAMEMP